MRKIIRIIGLILGGLLVIVSLSAAASAMANRNLPEKSAEPGELSEAEQAYLSELFHLRRELGDRVWPGFGSATIPVILYNEETVFLAGLADPPTGWHTVPDADWVGGPWRRSDEDVAGQPLFQQPLPASGETPQSFTVRVGNKWVASLNTLEWMQIGLTGQIRSELPSLARPFFPYSLFLGQLIDGSDQYLSLLAHEAFHAYQGQMAPDRLAAAEVAVRQADDYPWDAPEIETGWQQEIDLLIGALNASDKNEMANIAAEFLAARQTRRAGANLSPAQIEFEQQREWLEGLARYVELSIWREAATTASYEPVVAMAGDPDFDHYQGFEARWQRELGQAGRMFNNDSDTRFYYSGMGIAFLLDQLRPGWQSEAMESDVFLEDLLAEAIAR